MLPRKIHSLIACGAVGVLGFFPVWTYAQNGNSQEVAEAVRAVFYPYSEGKPHVDGITPGLKISQDNVQVAEKVLPPELFRVVQAGDFEMTVQETTDFPSYKNYVDASIQYAGQAQLGENGTLMNYTAGQPFPLLDPKDPQAGVKAAWNFRYRYIGDTLQTQGRLRSVNSSGSVERAVESNYARRYGMHRLDPDQNVKKWEKEGTWWREHSVVLQPQDLEGAQRLTFHYDADTAEEKSWAYDPNSRRTRSVVVNLYETSFGLNFLIEDHSGFNGHVHAHTWKYLGEQIVLAPGIITNMPPEFGGKSNWYPQVPWELRKAVVLEATPKDPSHPYGKRRIYIDRQFFSILYLFVYDHDGKHWRTLFHIFGDPVHDPDNAEVQGVPLHTGNAWIDYKNDIAGLWSGKVLVNKSVQPKRFTVKEMVRRGK